MELDWTTFVLEVLNFLVLVWLLKRFFYRPVLAVIEARRAETAKKLEGAEAVRREAQALKDEYAGHLASLGKESAAAKAKLDEDIAAERTKRLSALAEEIAEERKRREALEAREKGEAELAQERQAMDVAARFAARLLERVAGPELDAKLADLALSELSELGADRREALRSALREKDVDVKVSSAYALDASRRDAFTSALADLAGRGIEAEFVVDAALKAGVCITAGAWVLMANLRDELAYFGAAFEHGS